MKVPLKKNSYHKLPAFVKTTLCVSLPFFSLQVGNMPIFADCITISCSIKCLGIESLFVPASFKGGP